MNPETLQILKAIGYISLVIAVITNIAFYIKAINDDFTEASLSIILVIFIVLYIIGLACVHDKTTFMVISIIMLIIGGISLITLIIKAFSENLEVGAAALLGNTIVNIGGSFIILLAILPSM